MDSIPTASIVIEPFTPKYTTGIIDLIVNIQRKEFGIAITAGAQPDLKQIPEYYQKGRGNFWIARVENRVVGTIGLLDIGHHQAALRKMFVHSGYRGKKYKIAEKLLKMLFNWAGAKSVRKIFLGTTPNFLAAHRFYEKNGFCEISKKDLPVTFPVMEVDTKFYEYSIT